MLTAFVSCFLAASPIISIVPLGDVEPEYLEAVKAAVEARVEATVRIEPERELPKEAFYPPRKRWRAEKLLDALDANPPAEAWKVIGVTNGEISTTKDKIP